MVGERVGGKSIGGAVGLCLSLRLWHDDPKRQNSGWEERMGNYIGRLQMPLNLILSVWVNEKNTHFYGLYYVQGNR